MSINKVVVSGNLTREPELRSTASGMQVLNFGIAVNERVKNPQTDEWEDRPNFIDAVMFGKRAESVSRYIGKGSKVCIEGKLRYSSWEDKNGGGKRSKLEVVVDEIEFMSQQQGQQAAPAPSYGTQPAQPAYSSQPMPYAPPQFVEATYYDADCHF